MKKSKLNHLLLKVFRRSLIFKTIAIFLVAASLAWGQGVEHLFSFGDGGNGDGQFETPRGVAVNADGEIYVTDRSLHRIQVFDHAGAYQFQFGLEGDGDGEFSGPWGIALNETNGNLHIVDHNNRRVQVFDDQGRFQFQFGEFPADPRSIAIDSEGNTYVDDGAGSVHVFDLTGNFQFQFEVSFRPQGEMAIGPEGNIYIGSGAPKSQGIHVFNHMGEKLNEFGEADLFPHNSVAIDSNGDIYVSLGFSDSVAVYDSLGDFRFEFDREGIGDERFDPVGITIDDADRLYTTDVDNSRVDVWRIVRQIVAGDFDENGLLDINDVDLLSQQVSASSSDLDFDLNLDTMVDLEDLEVWIRDLKNTWFGDANLDGEFNSSDLVDIFEAGEYEDNIDGNSGWAEGDWNADGDFTTSDLTSAFQDGGYELGPRAAVRAVPEPSAGFLALMACLLGVGSCSLPRRRLVRRPHRGLTVSQILAVLVLMGTSTGLNRSADAASVLVLSSGNASQDSTLSDILVSDGHSVEIGPEYDALFSSFDLNPYSAVILQPNYNWAVRRDMPQDGQLSLLEFVESGGGLITTEWLVWKNTGFQNFETLFAAVPVVSTGVYRGNTNVTYNKVTHDALINRDIPDSFSFGSNVNGAETRFIPKPGATAFYGSDYPGGEGVIGWEYNDGRVISFSTPAGIASLSDSNYAQLISNTVTWAATPTQFAGDLNKDGNIDVSDVDVLLAAIQFTSSVKTFDLNDDGLVDSIDLDVWVRDISNTWFGDANLDGEFNSSDLVNIFEAGEYEDNVDSNSGWSEGDWNADGDFTTSDLTVAFQDGGYEQGLRAGVASVPEPSGIVLCLVGFGFMAMLTRQTVRRSLHKG